MNINSSNLTLNEDIEAVKKNYPNIKEEIFYQLIKLDPTYIEGKNSVGKYGKWILNLFNQNNLKKEDFYKVTEYLNRFENNKNKFDNKDIGQFKTLPDLYSALEEVENKELDLTNRQKERQFKKFIKHSNLNADLVYEDEEWEVWVPKDYESSCKLASGTQWCTGPSSKGDTRYYDTYSNQGPLFIIQNKLDNNLKYQYHIESNQFMDIEDRPANKNEFFSDKKDMLNSLNKEDALYRENRRKIIEEKADKLVEDFKKGNISGGEYFDALIPLLISIEGTPDGWGDYGAKDYEKIFNSENRKYFEIALPNGNNDLYIELPYWEFVDDHPVMSVILEDTLLGIDEETSTEKEAHKKFKNSISGFIDRSFSSYSDAYEAIEKYILPTISSEVKQLAVEEGLPENIFELISGFLSYEVGIEDIPVEKHILKDIIMGLRDVFVLAATDCIDKTVKKNIVKDFKSALENQGMGYHFSNHDIIIYDLPYKFLLDNRKLIADEFIWGSDHYYIDDLNNFLSGEEQYYKYYNRGILISFIKDVLVSKLGILYPKYGISNDSDIPFYFPGWVQSTVSKLSSTNLDLDKNLINELLKEKITDIFPMNTLLKENITQYIKKSKKNPKKGEAGFFATLNPNAGNVEYNNSVFNMGMGTSDGAVPSASEAFAEDLKEGEKNNFMEQFLTADELQEVKIEDRVGLWGEIDRMEVGNKIYVLFEHNTYGDETAYVVCELPKALQDVKLKNGKVVKKIPSKYEVCETYDTIDIALEDEGISNSEEGDIYTINVKFHDIDTGEEFEEKEYFRSEEVPSNEEIVRYLEGIYEPGFYEIDEFNIVS